MKELCLIDGDIIGYRVGFTTQNDTQTIAEIRTDELIRRIVMETNAKEYKVFLSGEDNFRYSIYPQYKANRTNKPKPVWLQAIRAHLIKYHNGRVCNGWEADDELGMEQTAAGTESIIATIDKDLLQVPGWHYNFVKDVTRFVSPYEGLRALYSQVIAGDGADNIPSYDGKMRSYVPQFIQKLINPLYEMTEEKDMYMHCLDVWQTEFDHLNRNCQCLYILRKENEFWKCPNGETPE